MLLSESLFSTAQASLCVGEVRSLKSTGSPCGEFWSQISTCILAGCKLNKSLHLTTWGSEWSCASGLAARLTLCQTFLTMSGFRTRHIFCCLVTRTLRTTSSGKEHLLSTVCKGHYTLLSELPGLPSPNIASLHHSVSRTTSPDLNPPDFYMWGYLKDRVYGSNPQTIPDRKAAIRAIPREECGRVIDNFARRIQMCLQRRGAHLEHIFWAPVKQRVFVVKTWNFGDVCYTGLT